MSGETEEKLPMLEQIDDMAAVDQSSESPADGASAVPLTPESETADRSENTDQEASVVDSTATAGPVVDSTATAGPVVDSTPTANTEPEISSSPQTPTHNHTDESNQANHVSEPPARPLVAPFVTPLVQPSMDTPPISPVGTPPVGTLPGTPGDKPVKPPRLKSMRSKEGPPQIKVRAVEEPEPTPAANNDIEAAALLPGPTGDASKGLEVESTPYEPTTAPLHPKQNAAVQPKKKFGVDYILGNKWILLGIIAVVLIILIIIIVGLAVSRHRKPSPPEPVFHSDPVASGLMCGQARGTWEHNYTVAVFKGIPYLKPPTGTGRWTYDELQMKTTSDCPDEDGVTLAKEFKGPCFQANPNVSALMENYIGTEDCLYLNIWTPAHPDKPLFREKEEQLPVLVYIHGGFLHYGSGHGTDPLSSPSAQLANEMNAVIVSFNYRLNVFGWLALQDITPDGTPSGNFGLYDQISALRWIRDYIENFGGNPNQVTVAGLSSGGTSILALLTNQEARETFQRAWISGASSKFDEPTGAYSSAFEDNKLFLRNVGCEDSPTTRICLLSKSSEELVDAIPWLQYPSWQALDLVEPPTKGRFIGPVLITDNKLVTQPPNKYFENSGDTTSNSDVPEPIPILIGNNEFETDMYQVVPVMGWTWGQYSDYVQSKYDTFNRSWSDFILNNYTQYLRPDTRLHMAKHVSDLRSICPQTFIADIISNNTDSPVYRYVNIFRLPPTLSNKYQAGTSGATHGTDFAMFFHYSDMDEPDFTITKQIFRASIKEFMVSGNLSNWKTFPSVYDYTPVSDNFSLTSSWTLSYCQKWKEDFYPDYSWMN